jgi:hypothetical protein
MKFLGHKLTPQGLVNGNFRGEVSTDLKRRAQGVRVKHRVDQNSVKMYDKAHTTSGSVLRVETTLNNEKVFRVYRSNEADPDGKKSWKRMRRGLADLHRRGQVSQQVNQRYLDALAAVDDSTRLHEILLPVEKRKKWNGQPVRALHPFSSDDALLLQAVARGEFMIRGLCNRDLQRLLFSSSPSGSAEAQRRSALVSRKLRLLRAHGIIRKIPARNLYHVTPNGRLLLSTFLIARQASANQLMKNVA